MDWGSILFVAASTAVGIWIVSFLMSHRSWRRVAPDSNPMPRMNLAGVSKAERQGRAAFVMKQVNDLKRVPWGEHAVTDRQEAERLYHSALETIFNAEGDYSKLSPVVDELQKLPLDLALTGVARIIMTLAYFRGELFSPPGVQAALEFTAGAVSTNPRSVDAWIMRLWIAASVPDRSLQPIAKEALKQVQALNPNHPYFPDAESLYYKRYGTHEQYETALRRMIELAPSPVVKRAGYDRLASFYAGHGRLDDAIATYRQMFLEFPEGSAWTWHNYSLFLLRAKRYEEALDASNRALSFFEFGVARAVNNQARKALGMPSAEPPIQ